MSRGVCQVDAAGNLVSIAERTKIYQDGDKITYEEEGAKFEVPFDSKVSMNFWCFAPSVFPYIAKAVRGLFWQNRERIRRRSSLFPSSGIVLSMTEKRAIQVIPTSAQWFGVTYKEDAPDVRQSLNALITAKGEYPEKLW